MFAEADITTKYRAIDACSKIQKRLKELLRAVWCQAFDRVDRSAAGAPA